MSNNIKLDKKIKNIKLELHQLNEKCLNGCDEKDKYLMSIVRTKLNILQALRAINEVYENETIDKRREIELNTKKNLLKKFEISGISKKMSTEIIKTAIENNKIKFELINTDDENYEGAEFTLNSISIDMIKQCNGKCCAIFDKESGSPTDIYKIDDDTYKMIIETLNEKNENFGYHIILELYDIKLARN